LRPRFGYLVPRDLPLPANFIKSITAVHIDRKDQYLAHLSIFQTKKTRQLE
jgi:hypothetical protein